MNNKYDEGFSIGCKWDCDYTPLGPFLYTVTSTNDPVKLAKRQSMAIVSAQESEAWKNGFKDGLAQRNAEKIK
jgi:hypothetical protein